MSLAKAQGKTVNYTSGSQSSLLLSLLRRLLIDTTDPNKNSYIKLLEEVSKEDNFQISAIIATHWHHDHISMIKDVSLSKLVSDDCEIWKFPRSDVPDETLDFKFLELKNGQVFDLSDGMKIKVYHTPGHTTDHVILFDEQSKALFSGDCILGEGTAVYEDLFDYMKSLEFILQLNPSVIYPGHGSVIEDPIEKIQYYINHRNERESQILAAIVASSEPLTAMDIVKVVYTTTPRPLYPAAAVNVNTHLVKLKKEGKVLEVVKGKESFWKATQSNKL